MRAFWRSYCCQCGATGAAHEPQFKEGSPCKPQMARTCEEVSLKSSYALVAAGVVLGSLAHGGALYWCLVLMVALFAAAVSVYRALVDENARLYFEKREKSAPFIRILIRALVEGPDESRREAARDLATRAAEKAFDRDLIASEGACPPLVELCRRGATDETRGAAAAALGNLAANALIRKRTLPASGAVDALLALCRSPCDDGDGARSACTALRNMAFDAETKATISEAGGVEVACSLLRAGATQARSGPYALQAAALLGTLCWGSAASKKQAVACKAVAPLAKLVAAFATDEAAATAAAFALRHIAADGATRGAAAATDVVAVLSRCARSDGSAGAQARSALRELAADEAALVAMGRCGGFHACAASLERGDGDGADAAAVLWAGSSKKASLTDVARALDVRSSRGPAIGRDVDLAIRALLRRTRSKAGKKDA